MYVCTICCVSSIWSNAIALQLGVSYVDLYLIHHPRLATPDIPTAWREMEKVKEQGLAKYEIIKWCLWYLILKACTSFRSIGVSNFGVAELSILLASAKVKPAANQVQLLSLNELEDPG